MKKARRIVACLCGLLVAVQALVSPAWAVPVATSPDAALAQAAAADCSHCKDRNAGHCQDGCGSSQCAHSANCGGVLALSYHTGFRLAPAARRQLPVPHASGFAPPDPDPRLRPPTLHAA